MGSDTERKSYADRIAEGAAADGWPWTLSQAEAVCLASRYGVAVALDDGAQWKLRAVAEKISEKVLETT